MNNSALGDGVALFHANHGNIAGSGGAPSITTLGAAFTAMATQQDALGQTMNVLPRFVLAAPGLAPTLPAILGAINTPDDSNTNIYITALVNGRLTGNAWYCIADPRVHWALDLCVLAGTEGKPRLDAFYRKSFRCRNLTGSTGVRDTAPFASLRITAVCAKILVRNVSAGCNRACIRRAASAACPNPPGGGSPGSVKIYAYIFVSFSFFLSPDFEP